MREDKINTYFSPTKGELALTNVMAGIAEFVAEMPDLKYTLARGSDSQVRNWNGSSTTNFANPFASYSALSSARKCGEISGISSIP